MDNCSHATKLLQKSKGENTVKRKLRIAVILVTIFIISSMLMQTAMATFSLVTNDIVNFRTSASVDAEVIRVLSAGARLEILDHDPGGWSRVSASGTIGYIKSEFLTIEAGAGSMTFRTIEGINFRTEPSLDSDIITSIIEGVDVEVLNHDPTGWSRVRFNGAVGYIKSEFLALPIPGATLSSNRLQSAQATTSSTSQTSSQSSQPATSTQQAASTQQAQQSTASSQQLDMLMTIDAVNLRENASDEAEILTTLAANTSVAILERGESGWTRVSTGEFEGYIRSDLLSARGGREIELLDWSEIRNMIPRSTEIHVIDVRTGRTYNIKCFAIYDHADVEPATLADTETFYDIRDGVRSWVARPVWVLLGDRLIAGSLHGMPHDVSWINGNGMDGHLCLHFNGSTTSSTSASYRADLQNAVQEAWAAR